ncbi:hypothetical protein DPEC_G00121540 [Dallia pectoralis]|uniref:Uncharacterized protein n=1 Tax=Dallia pectoralis TaxID=75939 RepID=A0ACC2GQI3_DALPE|nr:hypothetical protein DPEC_G00121540 [Dallia pectoralis]
MRLAKHGGQPPLQHGPQFLPKGSVRRLRARLCSCYALFTYSSSVHWEQPPSPVGSSPGLILTETSQRVCAQGVVVSLPGTHSGFQPGPNTRGNQHNCMRRLADADKPMGGKY